MTRSGIEPRSSGSLANTLPTRQLCIYIQLYKFLKMYYRLDYLHTHTHTYIYNVCIHIYNVYIYIYIYIYICISRDELIRDVLLWTPTHGRAKAGRPARTYIQQLCEDTGCSPEDLPRAMNDREEWQERVRDIRATSAT